MGTEYLVSDNSVSETLDYYGVLFQVWKRDMLEQLEAVAASERKAKEDRVNAERQAELEGWRERRREQLERLIEVYMARYVYTTAALYVVVALCFWRECCWCVLFVL